MIEIARVYIPPGPLYYICVYSILAAVPAYIPRRRVTRNRSCRPATTSPISYPMLRTQAYQMTGPPV